MGDSDPNYTNYNNTDLSQTNPIYQSPDDGMDGTDEVLIYMDLIKEKFHIYFHANLEYNISVIGIFRSWK